MSPKNSGHVSLDFKRSDRKLLISMCVSVCVFNILICQMKNQMFA